MPIVPYPMPAMSARDEVIGDLGLMIDEAASSLIDIDPYALASSILALLEESISSVDHDGNMIYR